MLVATLPTLTGNSAERLSEKIIGHALVDAVRYNSGGESPYAPKKILETLKQITDLYQKPLWIDLEGRQVRVDEWSPYSRGAVTLNRDFALELPAMVHFRGAGWFDVVNVEPERRKLFFARPRKRKEEYYLGKSQSVHIVAQNFEVRGGYLADSDLAYIRAARELGIDRFMLSFVERMEDVAEFYGAYRAYGAQEKTLLPKLVLKIESQKGVEFVRSLPKKHAGGIQLMAARDDLFLSFVEKRQEFIDVLALIIEKDSNAILASRLLSGLEYPGELTIGDMADLVLMKGLGYQHFMLSDEISEVFTDAMKDWREIVIPILEKNLLGEKKRWLARKK